MSRARLVAGNWKMHKTVAEAEAYVDALVPRVGEPRRGRRRALRAVHDARRRWSSGSAGRAVAVYAQNMHEARGGRVHRRGLGADARRARRRRRRARPLRAPRGLRRDRSGAGAEGAGGARRRPRADPLRRRDRGGAARRRHRAQAAPPGPGGARARARRARSARSRSPTSRSGRSGPARSRAPSRRRRRRASSGRSSAARRSRRRSSSACSTVGRSRAENAAELLALPDVDGALVGGASLEVDVVRRDRGGRARTRDDARRRAARRCRRLRSAWSCSTGSGIAPAGPGNARSLARTPVFDELWATYPHTQLITCGRAVGLPDGQMGNSEVGHLNLGAGAVLRQDLVRIDDAIADGVARGEPRRARRARRAAGASTCSGSSPTAASTRRCSTSRRWSRSPRSSAPATSSCHCFTDGRDTAPHAGVEVGRGARGGRRRPRRLGRRALLGDGSRRALGPRRSAPTTCSSPGDAPFRAASGVEAVDARLRARRDRRVHRADARRRGGARSRPGDHVLCFNFRPDRMRADRARARRPGASARSTAAAPRRSTS